MTRNLKNDKETRKFYIEELEPLIQKKIEVDTLNEKEYNLRKFIEKKTEQRGSIEESELNELNKKLDEMCKVCQEKEDQLNEAKSEQRINYTLFWAYNDSILCGNDCIDFERIDSREIKEILAVLRKNEIKEFTVSCEYSNLLETLADIESHGCKISGLTKVNRYRNKTAPALKVQILY